MRTNHNHFAVLSTLGLPNPVNPNGVPYKGARAIALALYKQHGATLAPLAAGNLLVAAGAQGAPGLWAAHYSATVKAVAAGALAV